MSKWVYNTEDNFAHIVKVTVNGVDVSGLVIGVEFDSDAIIAKLGEIKC